LKDCYIASSTFFTGNDDSLSELARKTHALAEARSSLRAIETSFTN
jgi:hypothetical protein